MAGSLVACLEYDEERAKMMAAACISIFAKPNGQLQLRFFETRQPEAAFFWKVFFKIRAQPLTAHDASLCHKY